MLKYLVIDISKKIIAKPVDGVGRFGAVHSLATTQSTPDPWKELEPVVEIMMRN